MSMSSKNAIDHDRQQQHQVSCEQDTKIITTSNDNDCTRQEKEKKEKTFPPLSAQSKKVYNKEEDDKRRNLPISYDITADGNNSSNLESTTMTLNKSSVSSTSNNNHRPEGKLSVVIPTAQKTLVTPTIITTSDLAPIGACSSGHLAMSCGATMAASANATPIQLFNSLVQLNGQDVSLFTGLPSCTPTSADGLAATGINPFFYGVTAFNQNNCTANVPNNQHNFTSELQSSIVQEQHIVASSNDHQPVSVDSSKNEQIDNNNNMDTCSQVEHQQQQNSNQQNIMTSANKEPKRQLSKLSLDHLQAANAMMLSPLLYSLSPEQENWLRQFNCFNQQRANNNTNEQLLQSQNNHLLSSAKNESNNHSYSNPSINHNHNSDCSAVNTTMRVEEVNAVAYQHQQQQQHQQEHFQQQIAVAQAAREFTNQMATIHNQHYQQQPNRTSLNNNNVNQLLQQQPQQTNTRNGMVPAIQQVSASTSLHQQTNGVFTTASIAAHDKQQQQQISLAAGIHNNQNTNQVPLLPSASQSISNANSNLSPYNRQFHLNHHHHHHHQNPQAFQSQSHTIVSLQNQISTQYNSNDNNCLNHNNHPSHQQQQTFLTQDNNIKQIDINNDNNNNHIAIDHRVPANTFNNSNVQPPAAHNQNTIQTNHNGLPSICVPNATSELRSIEYSHGSSNNNNNINDGTSRQVNYDRQLYIAQQDNNLAHYNHLNNQQELHKSSSSTNRTGSSDGQQRFTPLAVPKTTTKNAHHNTQQQLTTITSSLTPSYIATSETLSVRESISNNSSSSNSSFHGSPLQRSTSISSSNDANTIIGSVNPSPSHGSSSVSRDTTINVDQILTTTDNKTNNAESKINDNISILLGTTTTTANTRPDAVNKKTKKMINTKIQKEIINVSSHTDTTAGACLINSSGDITLVVKKKSKGGRKKKLITDEEMVARKNRSKERNRVAAKRCRQKRKQFLDELRGRIDNLNDMNRKLQVSI